MNVRALSLFGVLILAKILVLIKWGAPFSLWMPVAEIWQDVLAAAAFAFVDRVMRSSRASWTFYVAAVVYISLNVPVTLILSSPITPAMARATDVALSDSIAYYANFTNVAAVLLVLLAGFILPRFLQRVKPRSGIVITAAAAAIIAAGPFAERNVETRGLHRNAFAALWPVRVSGAVAASSTLFDESELREPPFPASASESLIGYRGAAAGRNVAFIILESTAAQYLGLYGAVEDPMPRLTEFASRALVFENAYSVYPESIKGLFATLCSRYPSFNTSAENVAAQPCTPLAQEFSRAGYRTGLFHSGRFAYLGMQSVVEGRGFETLEDAGAIGGDVHSSFGIDERSTVRRILSWIDVLPAGQRFFFTYLPVAGHHPYAAPEPGPFAGASEMSNYRNALHYADAGVGQLLDGLRERHLDRNTVFVIVGDHGEAFGQHTGNFGHTLYIYDENVHVPLIVAAPGMIERQRRIAKTASLIDVAPTLADLTGVTLHSEVAGQSLLPASRAMALFFTDYSLPFFGLRDACWKYIYDAGSSRSRLFDVCHDPGETNDVQVVQKLRVDAYRDRIQSWLAAISHR